VCTILDNEVGFLPRSRNQQFYKMPVDMVEIQIALSYPVKYKDIVELQIAMSYPVILLIRLQRVEYFSTQVCPFNVELSLNLHNL
jgi:hypothetical protein